MGRISEFLLQLIDTFSFNESEADSRLDHGKRVFGADLRRVQAQVAEPGRYHEDESTSARRLNRPTNRSSNHTTTSEAPTSGNTTASASMMNTPVFHVGRS